MLNVILLLALLAGSVTLIKFIDRWCAKPTFVELTRHPGNAITIARHLAVREAAPHLFEPVPAPSRPKRWLLLTWDGGQ